MEKRVCLAYSVPVMAHDEKGSEQELKLGGTLMAEAHTAVMATVAFWLVPSAFLCLNS